MSELTELLAADLGGEWVDTKFKGMATNGVIYVERHIGGWKARAVHLDFDNLYSTPREAVNALFRELHNERAGLVRWVESRLAAIDKAFSFERVENDNE